MVKVREPIVAGIFYPDSEKVLKEELLRLRLEAPSPAAGLWKAVITPHGAYEYTASVTTTAYLSLSGTAAEKPPERVLLIGPVHREKENKLILPESGVFRTPLGDAAVDLESARRLAAACPCVVRDEIPHTEEHCLETQVPFIQHYFPGAALLPVLAGGVTKRSARLFVDALFAAIPRFLETTLIVVTVNSAAAEAYGTAKKQAEECTKQLTPGNGDYFFSTEAAKDLSACSLPCIGLLLHGRFGFSTIARTGGLSSADISKTPGKTVFYSAYSLA
jgi:MEMO1 family protein